MPTYEYECKSCGEHLEVRQSFEDPALTECPACGGALRKVFGNIGISFKGSGFYRTDSRGGARTKDKDKDKETTKVPTSSDGKSSKSDSSKSDSSKSDSSKSDSSKSDSSKSDSKSQSESSKPSSSDGKGSGSGSSAPPKAAAAAG